MKALPARAEAGRWCVGQDEAGTLGDTTACEAVRDTLWSSVFKLRVWEATVRFPAEGGTIRFVLCRDHSG